MSRKIEISSAKVMSRLEERLSFVGENSILLLMKSYDNSIKTMENIKENYEKKMFTYVSSEKGNLKKQSIKEKNVYDYFDLLLIHNDEKETNFNAISVDILKHGIGNKNFDYLINNLENNNKINEISRDYFEKELITKNNKTKLKKEFEKHPIINNVLSQILDNDINSSIYQQINENIESIETSLCKEERRTKINNNIMKSKGKGFKL